MIGFRYSLAGSYVSVVRPIAVQVMNDLKSAFKMDHTMSVTLENAIKEFEAVQNTDPIKRPSLNPLVDEIVMGVEEEYNEDTLITNSANYNEYRPVIHDEDVGAWIRPVYVDSKLVFAIKYLSKSKSKVDKLMNELKLRLSQDEGMNLHSAGYTFYIPEMFIELFLDIYELKENYVNTGMSFEDYLISINKGGLTLVGSTSGKVRQADFAIRETQHEMTGYYGSDVVEAKGEYQGQGATWMGTFTYTVNINRPVALSVAYEPVIYNQLLPQKYVNTINSQLDKYDHTRSGTIIGDYMKQFVTSDKAVNLVEGRINSGNFVNIPNFDKFRPASKTKFMVPVFSVLTGISPTDLRTLVDLQSIAPGYELTAPVLDFLLGGEYDYIAQPFRSIFNVSLYNGNELDPNAELLVDSNLVVSSDIDLDVTKTYHVVFSLVVDIASLPAAPIDRALDYPFIMDVLLDVLNVQSDAVNVKRLTRQSLLQMIDNRAKMLPMTVQTMSIIASGDTASLQLPEEEVNPWDFVDWQLYDSNGNALFDSGDNNLIVQPSQ